jgi:hypothetical protein
MAKLMKKQTKPECEAAIRQMFDEWGRGPAQQGAADFDLSYGKFRTWADQKGYSSYFKFRSVAGADYDAEMWFAERFRQRSKY